MYHFIGTNFKERFLLILIHFNLFQNLNLYLVKSKYAYLYNHEYPYKIQHIWECEFFLLEVMVSLE